MKVKLDEFDLDDLAKVTDESVKDTVHSGRVDVREVQRTERALRLTETLVHQTLASYSQQLYTCPRRFHNFCNLGLQWS